MSTIIYKHKVVFLPEHTPTLCAELDKLSAEGWEFVAWLTDWLQSNPVSRMALMRRADSGDVGT